MGKRKGLTSKYYRVYRTKQGYWHANIKIPGITTQKHLGFYKTEIEAALASDYYIVCNGLKDYVLNEPMYY